MDDGERCGARFHPVLIGAADQADLHVGVSATGEKAPTPKLESGLYAAGATSMLSVINHVPETVGTLLVITHMPGVQALALRLASRDSDQDAYMDLASGFPTSSFAVLEHSSQWATLDGQDAELKNFVVPRP